MKSLCTLAVAIMFAGSTAAWAGEPVEKHIVKKTVHSDQKSEGGGAWLGVGLGTISTRTTDGGAKSTVKEGAIVDEVIDDSPAESVGLKEDDIIVEIDGKAVKGADDVISRIGAMKPGQKAAVVVMRDNAKKTFTVTLGSRPATHQRVEIRTPHMPSMPHSPMALPRSPMPMTHSFSFDGRTGVEGMKLMELEDQLGKYFEAPDGKALLVTDVKKNSNARKAGIQAGDVIVKAGSMDIEDMSDLRQALGKAKKDTSIELTVLRKGVQKTVTLAVAAREDHMMFNLGTGFPRHQNFNFQNLNFDHRQLREMMNDLQPQLDQLKKQIRVRVHGNPEHEPMEVEVETEGTEL